MALRRLSEAAGDAGLRGVDRARTVPSDRRCVADIDRPAGLTRIPPALQHKPSLNSKHQAFFCFSHTTVATSAFPPSLALPQTKQNKRDDGDDDNNDDNDDENLLRRSPASQNKRLSFCFI